MLQFLSHPLLYTESVEVYYASVGLVCKSGLSKDCNKYVLDTNGEGKRGREGREVGRRGNEGGRGGSEKRRREGRKEGGREGGKEGGRGRKRKEM